MQGSLSLNLDTFKGGLGSVPPAKFNSEGGLSEPLAAGIDESCAAENVGELVFPEDRETRSTIGRTTGIPSLNLSRQMERLAWQARARITWGAPPDEISDWLLESGADEETARRIIKSCMRERARSLRLKGLRDILIGSASIIVGGVVFAMDVISVGEQWALGGPRVPILVPNEILALSLVPIVFGVPLVWRGIVRTLLGARTRGADSDVGNWWGW
jgi:hypothetical protein